MDNEEKKVKTTTPKKKTTTKKVETKKTTKPEEGKTKTVKKTRTTSTKTMDKKEPVKKVAKEKTVKEEVTIDEKEQKVVTKEKKPSKELLKIRKKRYLIEAIIVAVLVLIVLILLSNRTFLKLKYENKNMEVSIPRFSYYVDDKDNKVEFITLRKSQYLNDYYNEYLEGFIFYSCAEGENTFYYNEKTKTLIKEIKVEKKFVIKTIEVTYDTRTPEEVCGLK